MKPNNILKPSLIMSPLMWVALVSVISNLFLVGVLASGIVRSSHYRHFGPLALVMPHNEYMVDGMVHDLDKGDAAIFRESIKSQGDALKQAQERVRQVTTDVAHIFEQDPPNPSALQDAIDRLGQAKSTLNDVVGKIVQDSYIKLSPAGRQSLAKLSR